MAWSDLAKDFEQDGAEQAANERLTEMGIEPTPLNNVMARKVVYQTRVEAINEFRRNLTAPASAYPPVPVANFEPEAPSPPLVKAQPTIHKFATITPSQACEEYFCDNLRTGGPDGSLEDESEAWTDKTRDQFRLGGLLLEQIMQGRPLASVTQSDLLALHQAFRQIHPPSFRKRPSHREMTLQQIVAETTERVAKGEISQESLGLSIPTRNRYWGFLRMLTTWLAKKHPMAELDYSQFIRVDKRNPRDLRDAFTTQQLETLFRLPAWRGCQSIDSRMTAGNHVIHDACYWIPMIGAYSGMRREEMCGLELVDVNFNGIPHFDVRDNRLRRLKNMPSRRKIPIASELLRLGLEAYVQALLAKGHTVLFPELLPESGKGTLGDALYKLHWQNMGVSGISCTGRHKG